LVSEHLEIAQRGAINLNWVRRVRRNIFPRRNNVGELLRRLEALEARLRHDESKDELENEVTPTAIADPMERLIEANSKYEIKAKT